MSLLIISGFEANGFAGLLKDTQVASAFGLTASAISTCQTAQSPNALKTVTPAQPLVLEAQFSSLANAPTVVKIGLVPSKQIAECIAQFLNSLPEKPFVIIDPVDSSSSDGQAFSSEPIGNRLTPLFPHIDLITPNTVELETLLEQGVVKRKAPCVKCMVTQAHILLKGGHAFDSSSEKVTDVLYTPTGKRAAHWHQPRLAVSARGTGCFLSTAIASCMALGYNLLDAITLANASLNHSLKSNQPCAGLPKAIENFPEIQKTEPEIVSSHEFPKLSKRTGLYPVVDSAKWIAELAESGVKTIQLRVKQLEGAELKNEIRAAIAIARDHELQLFINDYWQLAIELDAYGVHLGQEDLEDADLAAIERAGLKLGISTHGDFEFLFAKQFRPSYLAVGAIYPTQTKDMTGQIQGTDRLERYVQMAEGIPVVAIGGITEHNIKDVICTDVDMVAVVSAVTRAEKPFDAAENLHRLIVSRHL